MRTEQEIRNMLKVYEIAGFLNPLEASYAIKLLKFILDEEQQ